MIFGRPAQSMSRILVNNRKRFGCIVAMLMVVMSLSPAYVWRCLDGKACPMGGAMPHRAVNAASLHATSAGNNDVSPCCRHRILAPTGSASVAAFGMQCVLRPSDHPAAWRMRASVTTEFVDCPVVIVQTMNLEAPILDKALPVFDATDLPPPLPDHSIPGRSPPTYAS
jgi:hypothetical protein